MQDSTIPISQPFNEPIKKKRRTRQVHFYAQPMKVLINLLLVRRLSREQIAEHTGLTRLTVDRYINVLSNGKDKLVYVCEFKRAAKSGPYTAIYTWGPGEDDVPRPAPIPKSKRNYELRKARRARTIVTPTGVIHHAD